MSEHQEDSADQVGFKTFWITMLGFVLFAGAVFVFILPNGQPEGSDVDLSTPTLAGDHVPHQTGEEGEGHDDASESHAPDGGH